MESGIKRVFTAMLFSGMCSVLMAQGNDRAAEDIKSFIAKFEEGDALFMQKKYAEAATTLAAAQDFYKRAWRRDNDSDSAKVSLKPGRFPALRYYGYGFTSPANLSIGKTGNVEGTASGLHMAFAHMWQDASILSGASKFPTASGYTDDPNMEDADEDNINRVMGYVVGPVASLDLPVGDEEWHDVVVWSRRAQLLVEYGLKKFPQWTTGERQWGKIDGSFQHTGNAALAMIKKTLAEAEPEYAKVEADAKKAAPSGVKDWIGYKVNDLNEAISSAKSNGWVDWNLARDILITKDYLSGIRKSVAKQYDEEGKSMPADALKPVEDKVAELKSAMEKNASRWKLNAATHNAGIEAKAAASVKAKLPGSTVIKTALDSGEWIITKNDLGIPKYRSMGVLVLARVPGQSTPWLVFTYLRQDYAGAGTYNAGGYLGDPTNVRMQSN